MKNKLRSFTVALLCSSSLVAQQQVKQAEYFIDTDPGIGNGTAISFTAGDSVNFNTSVPVPGNITPGKHRLYIRTYSDSSGYARAWSHAMFTDFYVPDKIVGAEYFIDTDPGPGNGTAISTITADSISQSLNVATTGLSAGKHYVYVRTKSSMGAWSHTESASFYVLKQIVAGEYFFDTDPGVGNGTVINTGAAADSINLNTGISTTGLSAGRHTVYVRIKASDGSWSMYEGKDFYVKPKIIAAEYFWDTDPGIGNGTTLAIAPQSDSINQSNNIVTPCLTPGMHYLYVRSKDDLGRWGQTERDSILFLNPNMQIATIEYPGPGPFGTPVKLTATGGQGPYQYQVGVGTPTYDSIVLAPNGTSNVQFIATDACGYTADTLLNTPAAPTDIADGSTGSGTINFKGWKYWVFVNDLNGKIIAAVKGNGLNLGNVTIDYLKNAASVRQFPSSGIYYLDRNWHITAQNIVAGQKGLRLYALTSEFNALDAVDNGINAISQLAITKYNGANEDLSWGNNNYGLSTTTVLTQDSATLFAGTIPAGNGYTLNFSVPSFSEFYQSQNYIVPLGLKQVTLSGYDGKESITVRWHTEMEKDLDRFELLKMVGGSWKSIGSVKAYNGMEQEYSFFDQEPVAGMNQYKLQIIEADGHYTYSSVVNVKHEAGSTPVHIYPNPATDRLYVNGLSAGDEMQIVNTEGRIIYTTKAAKAEMEINTSAFATGIYYLLVSDAQHNTKGRVKFIKTL